MKNFVKTALSCFCACFLIFSCSDSEPEGKNLSLEETAAAENTSDKKAYITISLEDSLSAERTVVPTALDQNDLMYELWGQQSSDSVSRKLATWVSYDKLKEKRVIDIAVGEWTFTLKAFMDSNTQILTDTIGKSISYGVNTLSFNMKEVPGTGIIDVTFWYPKFESGCVKAELNSVSNDNCETNVYAKTQLEISAKEKIIDGNTYSSVAYKKEDVASGYYILKFYIYEHSSDTNPKSYYSTLVKVSHGSVSSGTEMLGEGNYVTIFRTASGIAWNSASYAKKYRVYKYETEDCINPKTFDTALFTSEPYETESTEYEIENALCGKNIYVAVKACSEKRESDFSNVICIKANTYPIKYESGEDTENIENPNPEFYSVADGLVLQNASRVGYVFGGWYENAGFTGEKVTEITKESRGNRILYAKWEAAKYTIVFDANASDATGTVSSVTASYGESLNLPANTFTHTGYTFKGWAKNSGAVSADYTDGASVKDLSSMDGAEVTLYAVWKLNQYTLQFNANASDATGTVSSVVATYGESLNLPVNTFTRTGYTFKGWSKNSGAVSADYTDGASVKDLASIDGAVVTLYAVWKANQYTLQFNANASDATGTVLSVTASYGEFLNLPANTFSRTGYTFKGWAKNSGAASADYTDGASVKDLSSTDGAEVTLYAVWQINTALFSVTLESLTTSSALSITVSGLTLTASSGYKSYRWLVDGIEQNGNTSSSFALSSTLSGGWHNITLVATDSADRIDSATAVVTIQK